MLLGSLLAFPVTAFTAEEAAEKVAEKAVEKAAEKAAEKAEEEAQEKAKLKAERPGEWRGPTRVEFLIFVVDIDKIDGASQSFAANVYVGLRWRDERLAKPDAAARQIPLEEVWNPRILLANQQGLVRPSLPEVVNVAPDGAVTYHQRYVATLSQPLELSEFPLDEHRFSIQFVAVGYQVHELEFVPGALRRKKDLNENVTANVAESVNATITGGSISERLSLPDWDIVKYEAVARPYEPIAQIQTAGFAFEFVARRRVLYYVLQVIVPLVGIVGMSWAAFWINPGQTGAQLGLAGSSILSLIAYRFVLANLIPPLPYMTRMDYFTLGSTLLVFFALVEVIVTSTLARKDLLRVAVAVDRTARIAFPGALAVVFVWSFLL